MAKDLVELSVIVADIFAVLATVYFIIITIFTENPCFSLIESYAVVTPIVVSYFGRFYKEIWFKKLLVW